MIQKRTITFGSANFELEVIVNSAIRKMRFAGQLERCDLQHHGNGFQAKNAPMMNSTIPAGR